MKFLANFFFAILLSWLLAVSIAAQVDDAPEDIKKFISGVEKAEEVPVEINKLVFGDLNGDKIKDAVIQYNVLVGYPGNNFISYIAVFLKKGNKYVFTVKMEN